MPKASVKRLIDNRKDKLIEFVLDIEKYPEFVPFCQSSKVHERKQKGTNSGYFSISSTKSINWSLLQSINLLTDAFGINKNYFYFVEV